MVWVGMKLGCTKIWGDIMSGMVGGRASAGGGVSGWRMMEARHLPGVDLVAGVLHPGLPERPEVFMEKFLLYPEGCMVLLDGGDVVGYGVGHPWVLGRVPVLDGFLGGLPSEPGCMYLHDVGILPGHRGGRSLEYLDYMVGLSGGLHYVAMVSVYGSGGWWSRHGFVPDMGVDVSSYGEGAVYMVRSL